MSDSQVVTHGKLVKKLVLTVFFMFGFGFALVPLYDVFCDITGLNGKTSNQAAEASDGIAEDRLVTVEFIARTQGNLAWQFEPEIKRMDVKPGEVHQVNFLVANQSHTNMVVQAVPSVSPGLTANYFNKIECFCFNHQPLKKGETASLGLQFYVDKELPKEFETVTLSYTLFDISDSIDQEQQDSLFAREDSNAQ